jgi:starch-binding outer membrane protein, SusD/RagB family
MNSTKKNYMKRRQILIFSSLIMVVALTAYACKKSFLDEPALGSFAPSTLANRAGVEGLLIGAYSMLDGENGVGDYTNFYGAASNWLFGDIASDDAYKGSSPGDGLAEATPIETYTATSTNDPVRWRWGALYDAIQRSNDVLRVMAKATDITPQDEIGISAEARFLRGFYHLEAKKIFNNIPFIDETISYADKNTDVPNDVDVWPKIEEDLKFAADNLPNDWSANGEIGRANKWAAKCFLAKAYMFQSKFADAKALLDDIILNGVTSKGEKYALMPQYHDNFDPSRKNNAEAVFSIQQSINDGSQGYNAGWGDVLTFPNSPAPVGSCCNFHQPSQNFVNAFKTDPATGLPLLDNFNDVDVKNDQDIESADPFTPESGTLDARLDWTVSRRGIPFLDWGINPGKVWLRDQSNGGPYLGIKRIYEQSQKGDFADKTFWTTGVSANNYVFLRFAEVLLWAAECEVEVGSLEKARDYVNQIRTRAANPAGWLHTYVDNNNPIAGFTNTPAANYKVGLYTTPWTDQETARNAVRFERRLELGQEGKRHFDLVRYGIADLVINAYLAKEKTHRSYLNGVTFVKGKSEYFPLPQTEIDKSNGALKQNSGY